MKISVSMLSAYLYCPRKLFLQRILRVEEIPKESIVLGSIRHEVYDFINKAEESIVRKITEKIDYGRLKEIYKQAYINKVREAIIKNKSRIKEVNLEMTGIFRKTWPYIIAEAEERATNIFNFITEHNIYGKELWEKLTPKILSEITIESDSLKLFLELFFPITLFRIYCVLL